MGELERSLLKLGDPARAKSAERYFKTGKGEYGYGDKFIGVRVPTIRTSIKGYTALGLDEIVSLLYSPIHELRLAALLLLVGKYEKSDSSVQTEIFELYLKNSKYINNWDLVDCSAPNIIGNFLLSGGSSLLDQLAKSNSLWERRIAIVATLAFIRSRQFEPTLKLAIILENDNQDLIQKAVGWMLREVGKQSEPTLRTYLDYHAKVMPRVSLRYAIERLDKEGRAYYFSLSKS
ncbi:MAG: DNA alkylation repair protein [Candidatus Saccharimonadia bacterium]